jgi:DNA-directed RNA polymerase subunit RPC12/RpoP
MTRPKHTCWSCGAIFVDMSRGDGAEAVESRRPLRCPRCGTDPQAAAPAFPDELLRQVPWSFTESAPPERGAFWAGLLAYNKALAEYAPAAALSEPLLDVVLPTWRARVVFRYRGGESEMLVGQKAPLTALDLLHQVYREWGRRLARMDHHFFEGFVLQRGPHGDEPPVYLMRLGS